MLNLLSTLRPARPAPRARGGGGGDRATWRAVGSELAPVILDPLRLHHESNRRSPSSQTNTKKARVVKAEAEALEAVGKPGAFPSVPDLLRLPRTRASCGKIASARVGGASAALAK